MAARTRGRPSKIDQVVDVDENGNPLAVLDKVIQTIHAGATRTEACLSAGISRTTLWTWSRWGQLHRATLVAGGKVTKKNLRFVDFLNALERAEAEAKMHRLLQIAGAASGGQVVTDTTVEYETVPDPENAGHFIQREMKRTVKERTLSPQWQAAAWWLERRFPAEFAKRIELHVDDEGIELDESVRMAQLAEDVRAMARGLPPIVDVDSQEVAK